jgi:hypothetical protein
LKRTAASILVPAPNNDKPIKFSANLPLKIHIEAKLKFVDYINTIAVMVSKDMHKIVPLDFLADLIILLSN